MKKPGNIFRELMAIVNLDRYSNDEALEYLAKLADLSLDLRKDEGLNHVIWRILKNIGFSENKQNLFIRLYQSCFYDRNTSGFHPESGVSPSEKTW